jgi:hypothetical protein
MTIPDPHNNGMGSIFNWVPLYRDEEYNTVLYNAVPDTPYYGKFALMSVDNHGRLGMYTVKEGISQLKEELEELYQKWDEKWNPKDEESETRGGWDKVYDMPIKNAMDKRGFEVHYG